MGVNGEIGILKQNGKQVAGFTGWSIDLKLKPIPSEGWQKNKVAKCKAKARKFWLCSKPKSNQYHAEFYQSLEGQLVLANEHDVDCDLPDGNLDELTNKPIEMIWTN